MDHGIYARHFTDRELATLDEAGRLDGLTQEIAVCRVMLDRALACYYEWATDQDKTAGMEVAEIIQRRDDSGSQRRQFEEVRRRRPDLWRIIDTFLGRIGRLVEQQAGLEAAGKGPVDPQDHAGRIQIYLHALDDITHGRSENSL